MSENSETVVLVADDEPSTLALVAEHVRGKGWKVIEASDGDMAWQLAHQHLPDLVILDVMMPGMSGWEVCRKIRESLPLAHTGVIMLTGIGQNLNEMTSPLYGADTHVDKPFEFVDLDEKIEMTLKERRLGAFGRADHADEEGRRKSVPPSSEEEAPLTAPTGGARLTKAKAAEAAKAPAAKPSSKRTAAKKAEKKAASKETPEKKPASKKAAKKVSKKAAKKKASKGSAPKKTAKKSAAKKATKKSSSKKAPKPAKKVSKKVAKKKAPKPAKKKPAAKAAKQAKKAGKKRAKKK